MQGTGIAIIVDPRFRALFRRGALEQAARAALAYEDVRCPWDLTLVVSDDDRLRKLNLEHRGVDAPTDVLSFASETCDGFIRPPGLPHYLGDVVISYPRALVQATEAGHHVLAELRLLAVHGVLHLLGHDHVVPDQRARMWSAQTEILRSLVEEVHPQE